MHNARMHEALCRLFPDAPEGAWELGCDDETDWDVAIAVWNLTCPPPAQEELDAVYALLAQEDAAAAQDAPPVVIASDTITVADAEILWAAAQGGGQTTPNVVAAWLLAKLEL
ncbi:XkdW family protein [Nitratidesulfovibrio sp. 1201_IL3209]|uniref:XkdW family protein n=1 Tax=Nitratidesulfovibrio sp. 1201_IL3209 TaxID=3084053 RepID=UPI002FDB3244